jgi:2-enoate reductase
VVSSVYQPEGFDLEAARTIREVTGDIPIMAHGKLNHTDVAEEALQEGLVDLVAIGHGLIADPHWANKVRAGKEDEVCQCIGCGECHFNSMKGWPRPCAVNPTSMHEGEYVLAPAKEPKRILVIGGGPGGMKAAATAAERGFDVTLWEKTQRFGGAMAAAGAMDFKRDVRSQVEYLERQIAKYDVTVEMGKEATIEDVRAFDPDFVVVATGADPIVIPVPGSKGDNVKLAIPVLLGDQQTGKRVAVIGGGDVGCELAVELCHQGKDVTIIEMLDKLMSRGGSFVANEQNLRYLVEHSGAKVMCSARMMEICDDGVIVQKDGEQLKIPCDTVVFAAGYRANHSLYEAVLDAGYDCVQVGDNVRPGKIIDAIGQGYNYIRVLE